MTSDLVNQEDLIRYKVNPTNKDNNVSKFLQYVATTVANQANINQQEIILDIKKDPEGDPEDISQRYIVCSKHRNERIEDALTKSGPYSVYVRM